MYNNTGLIPCRFLILIAHFAICVDLLWSSKENVKSCLNVTEMGYSTNSHPTGLIAGLSIALALIVFEFVCFISGFTMFNNTSALLSIGAHAGACFFLCLFVLDRWHCDWFWWIFGFGSALPSSYDLTVETSIRYPGWTRLLLLTGIATVIGSSTPVGYNIGVINTPGYIIKNFCNESIFTRFNVALRDSQLDILWSSIVSVFLIGGCVGSLSGSLLANKIGRKGGLGVASVLGVVAGIFFWCSKSANSIEMLLVGRIFGGLSAGLITTIMPMYLMELAPPHLKGATGALCPLGVTLGILIGQILSMYNILGNESNWPHCLALAAILQALYTITIAVLPESPKYLFIIKEEPSLAVKELKRIRNVSEDLLTGEIDLLKLEEQENVRQGEKWSIGRVLKSRELLLPLVLVCILQAGQQLSGVNAVFYYSSNIFKSAGLSTTSSELATIGAGCCNIFMALMSVQTMSWFKRRTILQISIVMSAVFLVILGLSISYINSYTWMPYLCIFGVLGYVLCYGLGLGPIPYFIGSELFEVGPRSSAMALGSMANWSGNFVIGLTFPTMASHIGAASFFIFASVAVAILIFVRIYLPETKGREACEIYNLVSNGFKSRPLQKQIVINPSIHFDDKDVL